MTAPGNHPIAAPQLNRLIIEKRLSLLDSFAVVLANDCFEVCEMAGLVDDIGPVLSIRTAACLERSCFSVPMMKSPNSTRSSWWTATTSNSGIRIARSRPRRNPYVSAMGVSSKTPGQQQQKGAKKGTHGASGYSPGHQMQARHSKKGSPGASGYAPEQTTGTNTRR